MSSLRLTPEDLQRITQLAHEWGKIVCRRAFGDQGPGLDVNLAQMEEVAHAAAGGLLAGVLEQATGQQADRLGPTAHCPDCGRECPLTRAPRPVEVRGGRFDHREPTAHCPTCRRDFFPSTSGPGA